MASNEDDINNNCKDAKVVLIGEAGVGKTSILKQFTLHTFDPDCASSISSQFTSKTMNITDTKHAIRFDLWDTAGQEKYRSLAKIFYKDASIIIFVYEITSKKSFEALQNYWYKQVTSNCIPNVLLALVGNKSDLYNRVAVEEKEAMEWADSIGAIFQATSAKDNTGIDLLFDTLGKKFLNTDFNYKSEDNTQKKLFEQKKESKKNKKGKKELEDEENNNIPEVKAIKLDKKPKGKNKKKGCC